jgi:hypothetical protein
VGLQGAPQSCVRSSPGTSPRRRRFENSYPVDDVLYGASNTGKSFTVKTIDFMLGGTRALPDIRERNGFERAWMAITLPKASDVTLVRALAGGSFEMYPGHVSTPGAAGQNVRQLSAKHNHTNTDNISQFLLDELGFEGKWVANDVYGKKRSLSFRDLSRFCIVDETAIQSEASPDRIRSICKPNRRA